MAGKCECDKCKCCLVVRYSTRRGFFCKHPNYKYISDYFKEHNIRKMVGFIGYSEKFLNVPKRKTTPLWCPEKGGTNG